MWLRHTGPGQAVFEATGPLQMAAAGPGWLFGCGGWVFPGRAMFKAEPPGIIGNSADKLRHTRCVAYSAEQGLLDSGAGTNLKVGWGNWSCGVDVTEGLGRPMASAERKPVTGGLGA